MLQAFLIGKSLFETSICLEKILHRKDKYSQHNSIIWPVWAVWLSVRLQTK